MSFVIFFLAAKCVHANISANDTPSTTIYLNKDHQLMLPMAFAEESATNAIGSNNDEMKKSSDNRIAVKPDVASVFVILTYVGIVVGVVVAICNTSGKSTGRFCEGIKYFFLFTIWWNTIWWNMWLSSKICADRAEKKTIWTGSSNFFFIHFIFSFVFGSGSFLFLSYKTGVQTLAHVYMLKGEDDEERRGGLFLFLVLWVLNLSAIWLFFLQGTAIGIPA
jgi:hypothetical protein